MGVSNVNEQNEVSPTKPPLYTIEAKPAQARVHMPIYVAISQVSSV